MDLIISKCAKSFNIIKMIYNEPSSNWRIATSSDAVYLKMMTHTTILLNDAGSCSFILAWVVFGSLTAQLRKSMQQEGCVLPRHVGILTKSQQINTMTTCRDLSRVSYKDILDMGEQIKVFTVRGTVDSNASLQHFHADYEEGEDGVTMRIM